MLGKLRKKLDDKGELMILIGYHSTKYYNLNGVENISIVISRDAIVDKIKELQHSITDYQKALTIYSSEILVSIEFDNAEMPPLKPELKRM